MVYSCLKREYISSIFELFIEENHDCLYMSFTKNEALEGMDRLHKFLMNWKLLF